MADHGEVPFAVLGDGSVVIGRFHTRTVRDNTFGDTEVTDWTLLRDGREFTVVDNDGKPSHTYINDLWTRGGETPLTATVDGDRHIVRFFHYYGHHLGSVSGYVTMAFDITAMTATVNADLKFESD